MVKILIGTILLYYFGYLNPSSRSLLNTLFMSVSAVCVTGLSVMDVGTTLSNTGQIILICLVELGGIGIFCFSNWIMLSLSGSLSTKESMVIADMLGSNKGFNPGFIIKSTLVYTLGIELIGALFLFFYFIRDMSVATAIKYSVFHSISAFCNSGFTLFPDSLASFSSQWYLNIVIAILVLFGGIGFLVSADVGASVLAFFRKRRRKLLLHSKIILVFTGIIIVVSSIAIFILEIENSRMDPELNIRIFESLFIAIASRTAGFSQVDMNSLTNMSLIIICLIMFIGASPGSTAGGIKITTFAILCGMLRSQLTNRSSVEIMYRRVPSKIVSKAMTVVFIYCILAVTALVLLQFTELYGVVAQDTRGVFIKHLFEVISALSTVGLSTGVTESLSNPGLCIIMGCMFIGRLGAIVIIASVIGTRRSLDYKYPPANILVG